MRKTLNHTIAPWWLAGVLALAWFATSPPLHAAISDEDIASLGRSLNNPAQTAQVSPEPPSFTQLAGRMIFALGVVLALMTASMWAIRRWMPQAVHADARRGTIDVLATRSLGPRKNLVLVRARDRTLLIGVTHNSIRTLAQFDPPPAWTESPAGDFDQAPARPTARMESQP